METRKILKVNWGYPVNEHLIELSTSIMHIERFMYSMLDTRNQFVGIGASGATLLGALVKGTYSPLILLRKKTDPKYKDWSVKFNASPITIIDDHILEGRTLRIIAEQLTEAKVISQVTMVIARCWEDDNPVYLEKGKEVMQELFPNIKIWAH